MAILRRAAVCTAALLVSVGCERAPTMFDVNERSIAVHALLVAASDTASVLITRPSSEVTSWDPMGTSGITDALVRLIQSNDTITLSGTRVCMRSFGGEMQSQGCYTAHVPNGILGGALYELLVSIPGEALIRGTTRVPFPAAIIEPNASAEPPVLRMRNPTLPPTSLPARWTAASAQARAELRFATERSDCVATIAPPEGDIGFDHIAVIGTDTATVTAASVHCAQPLATSYAARLVLTVYDESYSRYLETIGTKRVRHAAVGLTGALGVFAAAANTATPVVLTRQ
jgi:hypothetical protein